MAKKPRSHHKKQHKWLLPAFIGLVVLLVALLIVNAFLPKQTATTPNTALTITEDGHVHTTDGQHVGTYEEIFGQPWEEVVSGMTPADGETAEPTAEPAADPTAEPTAEPAA